MEKPKRKVLDWHNALMANCGCGRWAKTVDGMCAECHDANYNADVEFAYLERIRKLEDILRTIVEAHETSCVDWPAMRKAKELLEN